MDMTYYQMYNESVEAIQFVNTLESAAEITKLCPDSSIEWKRADSISFYAVTSIDTAEGRKEIKSGDYIFQFDSGKVFVVSEELFEELFYKL